MKVVLDMRSIKFLPHFCFNRKFLATYTTRWFRFGLLIASATIAAGQTSPLSSLRDNFKNPPPDCRIMMRWWWFGPSVTKPELERELRVMKEGGIGGVEVQPVYPLALDDPQSGFRNFPYLSDQFIDALRFAAQKSRELGLRFDLTLGSGWPFGGPHIPVTEAAGKLRLVSMAAPPETNSIPVPDIGPGEKLLAAFLRTEASSKDSGTEMLNLSDIRDGRLYLPQKHQPSTVLWFIASRTGMMVKRPALDAEGFVLDHYDRAAIENHLHTVGDRLMQAFGKDPPYAIFSDSLEVYDSDWTGDLLEQFRQRRGYDLTPYLPALAQDVGVKTAAIRHDWGQTLSELADERYLTPLHDWAALHKTQFRSQNYGTPPVTLSSNRLVDLPEGEGSQWRSFSPSRWASSASHLYSKNITSAETWTWLHSPAFRATPLDMKAQADLFFLQGINQLVGHGWPYSPLQAGEPGWHFYAAAVFNNHNPWWLVMPDITRYLQRVSYVLRQGKPANDVALLLPTDDAWSQFTLGEVSVSESMDRLLGPNVIPQILNAGFNFDFIDAEAINRVGIPYSVLILPGIGRIPLETYSKIEAFTKRGGIVIATRSLPSLAPGLLNAETDSPKISEISDRLFRASNASGHFISDDKQLAALLAHYFKPDVSTSPQVPALGFVHRKSRSADIFFLANTSNKPLHTQAAFRVSKSSAEWWDFFSGSVSPAGNNSTIELNLQPYESRVIVFTDDQNSITEASNKESEQNLPPALDLATDWTVSFSKLSHTVHMDKLRSWADDKETAFYSGEAIYEKDIEVPLRFLKYGTYLDFGPGTVVEQPSVANPPLRAWLESPVREAAQVFVNGQTAGSVWKPPYELDISNFLHAGKNHLKIIVANLAINTMAGHSLPDYTLLNDRYGERFVPQDMQNLQPLPSGLLAPVRLVAVVKSHAGTAESVSQPHFNFESGAHWQ